MKRFIVGLGLALAAPAFAQQTSLEQAYGPIALMARETHGAVTVLAQGEGANRVYVFLPSHPALHGAVPLVLFAHGWQGMNPKNYGALIDHLVREGEVVIYPVYQDSAATSPQKVVGYAAADDRAGLAMLEAQGLKVDPRRVLYFGYSMGAAISLDLALAPSRYGLPAPRAIVLLAPGDAPDVATGPQARSIIGDLSHLPRDLPVAVMAGAEDTAIGLPGGREVFRRICPANPARRVLMILPGDEHGGVTVHAGHGAPGAPDERYDFPLTDEDFPVTLPGLRGFPVSVSINQLDYYGFWKVTDALIDSLPAGALPAVVFGYDDPAQTYLGVWPDGTPYRPLTVLHCN